MLSPKFERVKQLHPSIAVLLDRVADYLCAQHGSGQQHFIPKLAAAALKVSDGDAFVLLEMLAKGGVLRRVYNVYCQKENTLLTTADGLDALDDVPRCDFCNTEHAPSDLTVEVAFVLASKDLRDVAA